MHSVNLDPQPAADVPAWPQPTSTPFPGPCLAIRGLCLALGTPNRPDPHYHFFLHGAWTQSYQGLRCTLMVEQNKKKKIKFDYIHDGQYAEANLEPWSPNVAGCLVSCWVQDCVRGVLRQFGWSVSQMRARLIMSSLCCLLRNT